MIPMIGSAGLGNSERTKISKRTSLVPQLLSLALLLALPCVSLAKDEEPKKYKSKTSVSAKESAKETQKPKRKKKTKEVVQAPVAEPVNLDRDAEARLLEIYRLTANGQNLEAIQSAAKLVQDRPNFQLAQLVYGDLLSSRSRTIQKIGDIPDAITADVTTALNNLRDESQRRVSSSKERPSNGLVPSQFLKLAASTKNAIAVDASKSRLYLFENSATGMRLVSDYYMSVGKAGVLKNQEGDLRTPLGVYYITSHLDRASLSDFYGAGALPLNYPNMLDQKRGKSGGGIWLHGTPPNQFSRAPRASEGCVVLSNPDIADLIRTVKVRTTPVVIASELNWQPAKSLSIQGKTFESALNNWRTAKVSGDAIKALSFYTSDFSSNGKSLIEWGATLKAEMAEVQGKTIELKDLSYLQWADSSETMVVTFGEVIGDSKSGKNKRQYWIRSNKEWKIFHEGTV